MPATAELKKNDIIEIAKCDENGKLNIRRVKVERVVRDGGKYHVRGVNLLGQNPINYVLPLEPTADILREPNFLGWFPFVNDGTAEE